MCGSCSASGQRTGLYLFYSSILSSSVCLLGARGGQAGPFAAWLCAGSVIQYSRSTKGRNLFLQKKKKKNGLNWELLKATFPCFYLKYLKRFLFERSCERGVLYSGSAPKMFYLAPLGWSETFFIHNFLSLSTLNRVSSMFSFWIM